MARIGVDFGGVLTKTTTPPPGDNRAFLRILPRESAKIMLINLRGAGHELFLISKASSETLEDKARVWLDHHGFKHIFGPDNIQFCRTPEGKIGLCEALGIEIMIDDNPTQLELLEHAVKTRILFGENGRVEGMVTAENWSITELVIRELTGI